MAVRYSEITFNLLMKDLRKFPVYALVWLLVDNTFVGFLSETLVLTNQLDLFSPIFFLGGKH